MSDQPPPDPPGWAQGPPPPPGYSRGRPTDLAAGLDPGGDRLHPGLPGTDAYGARAHHQPHAAAAGPGQGARGAMWFALAMAVLVVASVLGLIAIALG